LARKGAHFPEYPRRQKGRLPGEFSRGGEPFLAYLLPKGEDQAEMEQAQMEQAQMEQAQMDHPFGRLVA
jgi:hypothetical protein